MAREHEIEYLRTIVNQLKQRVVQLQAENTQLKVENEQLRVQLEVYKEDFRSTAVSREQIWRWSIVILVASLLFIFYSVLFPFDFFSNSHVSITEKLHSFSFNLDGIRDFPQNVLLFIPLGFSLSALFGVRGLSRQRVLILTLAACFGLSLLIEITQTYSAVRFPTITDVVANVLGAFLGARLFEMWGEKLIGYGIVQVGRLQPHLTWHRLTIALLSYFALMLILTLYLTQLTSLANWDTSYPLLLGNELTDNRAWHGTISHVFLADRVLSNEEITRLFNGDGPTAVAGDALLIFQDFTDDDLNGNFPAMIWQGEPAFAEDDGGIVLGIRHWLKSNMPVTEASQTLAANSQFTLEVIFTPDWLEQSGPARIVSISQDTIHRNLTLGQQETDLALRLRTPFTGENGVNPQLVIPNFFTDTRPRHIVITYDGTTVRFYLDDPKNIYYIELSPAVAFYSYYPSVKVEQIRLHVGNMFIFILLYDAMIFVPLSAVLVLLMRRSTWLIVGQIIVVVAIIIVTVITWEWVLSLLIDGYALRLDRVLPATGVGVVAYFVLAVWSRVWS